MKEIVPYQNYQNIVSYGRSPEVMQAFSLLLGRNAPYYIQSAITAVQANEQLMQCTPRSIFSAALRAATLRLSCDPAIGHAWLVPYKNNKKGIYEAQFQAGWRGIQHMALRTSKYRYINVSPVYEGEEIVEDRITGSLRIEGAPKTPKKEKGLLASFALLSGYHKSIYMSNEEMEAHGKKYSKGYNKEGGIWLTNKPAAYHKTILLKLLRTYGYIDPSDAAVLEDESGEVSDLELPDEGDVTIIEHKPITAADASKILGFGDDEHETGASEGEIVNDAPEPSIFKSAPTPPPAAPEPDDAPAPALSLEEAYKITNRDGLEYGKIPTETLQVMQLGIKKALNNPNTSADDKAEWDRKRVAINLILTARKNGEV